MTKQQKQLILIAVLSLTLYSVWPSGKSRKAERKAETADARPVSLNPQDREPPAEPTVALPTLKKRDTTAIDRRQRWSIDEILQNNPFQRTNVSVTVPAKSIRDVQAVYFSSSSQGVPAASAVVDGQVVSQGHQLAPDQTVLEIRETGIAVGR